MHSFTKLRLEYSIVVIDIMILKLEDGYLEYIEDEWIKFIRLLVK